MLAGSTINEIFPGDKCIAGDRETKIEGAAYSGKDAVFSRVEQEANWQVTHAARAPCQDCQTPQSYLVGAIRPPHRRYHT